VDAKHWIYIYATRVRYHRDVGTMTADVAAQLRKEGLKALLDERSSGRCLSKRGNVSIRRQGFKETMEPRFILLGMSQHSRNAVGGKETLEGKLQDMIQSQERGEGRLHHYADVYPPPKDPDAGMVFLCGAVVFDRPGPEDYVISPTTSKRTRPQPRPSLPSDPVPIPPDIHEYITIRHVDDSNGDVVGRFLGDMNRFYGQTKAMEDAVGAVMKAEMEELGVMEEDDEDEEGDGDEEEEGKEDDEDEVDGKTR